MKMVEFKQIFKTLAEPLLKFVQKCVTFNKKHNSEQSPDMISDEGHFQIQKFEGKF